METNKRVIQRIEELKPTTESSILYRQKGLVPTYIDLKPKIAWDAYTIASDRFTITGDFKFGLIVSNLPYNEDAINKRENPYFIDSLENMVKNNEINSIFIFYNNKFIPWSRIKIVRDMRKSYLLLGKVEDYNAIDTLRCISFPFNLDYRENITNASDFLFQFNDDGLLDTNNGTIGISPMDPCIFSQLCIDTVPIKNYNLYKSGKLSLPEYYSFCKDNCNIIFKDGLLSPESEVSVNKSNFITIDNGEKDYDTIAIVFFYFLTTNINSSSHEFKITNADELRDETETEDVLLNRLDFSFSLNKLYDTNISDALRSVMDYDSELMDKIYKDLSLIKSLEYTGQKFIKCSKNGYVYLSEIRKKQQDDGKETLIKIHPMIFVNNNLFANTRGILHEANLIKIPIAGIKPDDRIEILFFKEIINTTYRAENAHVIDTDTDSTINTISTEEVLKDLDDLNLEIYTSANPYHDEWNMTSIDEYDRVQFKLDKKVIEEDNGNIGFEINLGENTFLGTIPITLVSKKQFRYMGFISETTRFNFELSPDFNFCINKNQYMIFVNGKKINQDNFRLITAHPKRPFDDMSIYMTYEFEPGDRVDVFYLPIVLREFVTAPRIPVSGNIYLDRTQFDYGLNKDMYLIFVNGDKIPYSDIKNINSSKLHIDADIHTLNDLCVLQHIKSIDVLREAFIENESEWDKAMNSTEFDKLSKMLGFNNTSISDTQEDFNAWQVSQIEINTEIARDYWLSTRVYEYGSFIYDYEDIIVDGRDADGNEITRLQNAMIEYNRLHSENKDNISDEDLAALAKYTFDPNEEDERLLSLCKAYMNREFRSLDDRLNIVEDKLQENRIDFTTDFLE